jgi:hypothetical protein
MPIDPKTADLMLSDWEGWEKTLNDGQRQELESMLRFEPDREAAKKRFAGVAYVAATTGTDAEEVSRRFEDWYLPAFTIDETVGLGRKEPVKDAGQFFDLLKDRASNNRARLDALLSAQEEAFRSAIADGDDLADFSAWQATQDNDEAWQGKAREAWQTARRETLERLGPDGRGLAARVVRSLRHEMGVAVEPDAWINQTREMLVDLKARDAEKYELVLAAAKAFNEKQQQPDKGIGQGVAESFGRGAADLVAGLPRALVDMSQDAAEAAARAGFTNAPDPEALADKIKAGRDVDIDLRDLARGVIDPVKSKREGWAKYAEEALYLGAGSLPYAIANPMAGGSVVVRGMFAAEAYNDLRQSGFTGVGAAATAIASGYIQQKIETWSEWLVGVPSVARWMSKWGAKPGSSWIGQLLPRAASRLGTEYAEEFAQQLTTPALQELGAALTEAVPDRPEGQKMRDVVDQFISKETGIPLALSVLPIAFIGAGLSTGRDLAVIEAVMQNPRYLRAVMSEEKARAVMEEPNADKRAELIREGWEATPTPVIVERVQAIQQEERKEATEALRIFQEAERAGMIPTIRRDAQGWTVERDGASVRVSTREEAVAMAYASLDEMERKAAEATAQAAEELMQMGGARAEAFEISRQNATTETLAENGVLTPEQVAAGVETYAQLHGLTREEAAAEAGRVLGFNRMEQVENVRTAVSRIYGGGNVLTVIEEGVHGRWTAGLERGHYTHQMGITWVRMAEQASGFDFLPSRDDTAITPQVLNEAIAAVVQADLLGRRKDGKQHFTPGLISRGVASFALSGRAQAKQAGRLATFLKSWREFWGQVLRAGRAMAKARREGKLGDDFDVLLDDLLGTEPQQRFEAQAAREAADLAAEIDPDNVPFSLGPMPAPLRLLDKEGKEKDDTRPDERHNPATIFQSLASYDAGGIRAGAGTDANERRKSGRAIVSHSRFVAWARENGREIDPASFQGVADAEAGGEHSVFLDKETGRVIKLTKPGLYGYHAEDAGEYLQRWALSNRLFGDDATFEGITQLEGEDDFRAVFSQSFVPGRDSTPEEVADYLKGKGFAEYEGNWVHPILGVTIRDTLTAGNAITTPEGEVAPIDWVVEPTEKADLRDVRELTGQGRETSFSLAPRSLASVADTVLAAQMRKPEFREKYLALARQRLDKLRQDGEWRVDKWGNASRRTGTDTQAERIRTPANIEAERKFRQRSRQRELIDEGMATLTPATLAAYEQGLTTIEDDPLVSAMLGLGHLMSKTEAAKAGKLKTDGKGNAGDYDGAPWLPPSWYAGKGKGYMPDTMAQELHEAGLLKDAYPDTLWEALGRSIGSARAQNEEVRKAQAAVRAIEKNAAEQSRAEAEAWAKDERAKVPSAKDRQMAALRTLDVILSAFPPVVRGRVGGFVKLASLGTDKAREAEILRRLDKLDEVVEDEARKHYAERIDKLFERAKPKKEAGKKPQGKLGPEAQRLVDLALTFSKLTEAEVAAERAAIASRMETATGAEVVDLLEREQVLDLFGALEQRTAAEMEAAHDWLADTYTAGRNRWRAVVEARAQETEERRVQARKDIGKQGLDAEQQAELERAKKIGSRVEGMNFTWLSFERVVQSALGRGSKLGRDLVRAARAATNAKTDAMRAKRREFRAVMAAIFGTTRQREWQERLWELSQIGGARAVSVVKMEGARVEERTVPVEIVERIIAGEAIAKSYGLDALTVDILEAAWAANEALPANRRKSSLTYSVPMAGKPTPTKLSQLQAVHVTMLARQASYSENMAGHGWTDEVLKEIEAQLTPEAKAIRAWLADQYRGGYDSLNAVYSRMYGVNLPRLTNYAPGTFEARDMMGAEIDPYGQGLLSEGGFRAGMLKTRGQHKARPRLEDALAVYWGHVNATEHFKAFGEFARDLRAVLNEASVRASIKAKGGATLLEAAQKWQEAFERNGLEARSASKAWDEFLRKRQSSQAFLALAYNMGTLMKQSTAALGAMLNMGPTAAARQFGRLLTGQLELGASYRSAVIQRRLDAGYSPEVRQAMAAMMADRPTWASAFLQRGMETIGLVDAVFTTASHAMAWDYHFSEAKAGGLTDAQARQVADLEAEATVARTAQPSEMMDRSLGELGMAPMARFLFMFATEARQKAALALEAYSPSSGLSKGERAMRLLLLHVVFPLAIQTVTNLWRDARDDDDDELFDEDNWRGGDYLKAMLLGPVLGLPLIGGALNAALTPVFGGHYFANDPTQPLNKAATGAGDIFEAIEEGDLETGLKGARSLLWALALAMGGEKSAGLGVGANILYDAFRVGDNSLGEADD